MQTPPQPAPGTQNDSRRVPRFPFIADVEVTDVESHIQITQQTRALSLLGFGVDTINPFPVGASVRIKMVRGGLTFAALGPVAYARPDLGMGILFTNVEPEGDRILQGWLAELWSDISLQL